MKITEDVRRYAAEHGVGEDEAIQSGLDQKAREFVQGGAELYQSDPVPAGAATPSEPVTSRNRG